MDLLVRWGGGTIDPLDPPLATAMTNLIILNFASKMLLIFNFSQRNDKLYSCKGHCKMIVLAAATTVINYRLVN